MIFVHVSRIPLIALSRCVSALLQVKRCPRARPHDWTCCPFAHPGEKAKRRDPRRYRYSGTACPDFRKVSWSIYMPLSRLSSCSGVQLLNAAPPCCRMARADGETPAPLRMAFLNAGCTLHGTGRRCAAESSQLAAATPSGCVLLTRMLCGSLPGCCPATLGCLPCRPALTGHPARGVCASLRTPMPSCESQRRTACCCRSSCRLSWQQVCLWCMLGC